MSILPSQTQSASSSSSSLPIPNPNSQHGVSEIASSLSPQLNHALGSLQISDYPGPSTPAAEDSGRPSEKVTELESSSGMKAPQRNSRSHSRSHSGRRTVGLSQSEGMTTGTISSHRNQQATGSVYSQGSTPFGGRKSQMANGNHLLNFQYDPISRSQQRGPPPPPPARRQRKRRPYNKDLFLQANFKFMVLDSGNYSPSQWIQIKCYSGKILYV
ncbi:unnamed protein product [Vicia faba]|uniref:Uncharacterized protein n=1 Tax=Vicia faba TaxID=3906 RepID=A0AAV1AWD8_VICFA|nr:unnamed protein product [Vicia faba]